MGFRLKDIEALYPVPWVDYGGDRQGTLIAAGSGMMMAMMDLFPLRLCLDIDTSCAHDRRNLVKAAQLLVRYHPPLMLMGWHTIRLPPEMPSIASAVEENGDDAHMMIYAGGGLQAYGRRRMAGLRECVEWGRAFFSEQQNRKSGAGAPLGQSIINQAW